MIKKVEEVKFTNEVCESVRKYGLINPLVVEPRPNGKFGVLLGDNRFASIFYLIKEGKSG